MTEKHLTDQKFNDLNLAESLKKGLSEAGFEFCTPIQAESLPEALEGKDVAGQAQTGTGKTVAFLLACCNYLLTNPAKEEKQSAQIRGLILAPTRELAIQIFNDADAIAKHTGLKLGLVYGGTGYEEQKTMLSEGVDILIGTPGRLIDFYKQNLFGLKYAQTVVLDEADRMFDLGFIKDIRYLLRKMPPPENRMNLLYSATLSFRVMELAYEHMNNPVEIKIDTDTRVAAKINEYCFYPADDEKPRLLINLLNKIGSDRALVFVNTRHAVEEVSHYLNTNNFSAAALSGDVPQKKREGLLEGFKQGKYNVLVATDVAARGLHIPEVSHVFNYDLPQDAEDYVHRIGRTARAGSSGEAISFLCEKYAYSIMDIEEYISHAIPKQTIEAWMLEDIIIPKFSPRNRKGKPTGRNAAKSPKKNYSDRKPTESMALNQGEPEVSLTEQSENSPVVESTNTKSELPLASTEQSTETQSNRSNEEMDSKSHTDLDDTEVKETRQPVQKARPKILFTPPKNRFSRKFGETPLVG